MKRKVIKKNIAPTALMSIRAKMYYQILADAKRFGYIEDLYQKLKKECNGNEIDLEQAYQHCQTN